MNGLSKTVTGLLILGACVAMVPLAANAGLLILGIEPNPRRPPADVMGEAVGWAMLGLLISAVSTVIGESVRTVPDTPSFYGRNKGLILGSGIGAALALFFGSNFAVLQMASVDGQAITSVTLGVLAGGTVAFLGAVAGAVMGTILRRAVLALAS